MSQLQVRSKTTNKVLMFRKVDALLTAVEKNHISQQMVAESKYNFEDVYVTEMSASTCINKWDFC